MKKDWKVSMIETLGRSDDSSVRLRHGLPSIPASAMAGQYYCELKVDNSFLRGDIPTEAKTEGDSLHQKMLEMKKTSIGQIIEDIDKEPVCVAAFPLASKVGNVDIVGLPDA